MSVALGTVSVALVATTALAVSSTLRLRSLPELLLGAYVIAFAEIVVLVLVLTPAHGVRRPVLLFALVLVWAAAVLGWVRAGRPRPDLGRPVRRMLEARHDTTPIAIAIGVALAAAYVVALALGTAPTTWDALQYHLPRAALWRQEGAIGYIADAYDRRLNANLPHAEIVMTFALEITRLERAAALVQLVAWLASGAAVTALARRVGLGRREAAFGGLAFLLLPIVLLQSSGTHNDLVLASLLLCATVFATRGSKAELGLAGVATALAVGTKVTAVLGLPLLIAVAVVAEPRSRWVTRAGAVALGAAAGSYWYVVNLTQTDAVLGGTPDRGHVDVLEPRDNLFAAFARVLDLLEVTGVQGWGAAVYVAAATIFAGALVVAALAGRTGIRSALVAGALTFLPLALFPVSYAGWRVFARLHDLAAAPDHVLPVDRWVAQTVASEDESWFGPVGLLLALGVGVAALVLVRRRRLPPLAAVLALGPLGSFAAISLSLGYDPWQGRFLVYAVGLSASLWGLVLRRPPVAWATVAVSVAIAALSLAQFEQKPLSEWPGSSRWELQSVSRVGLRPLLRFVEESVPAHDTVALALGRDDWGYPAFGPRLTRRVVLVPLASSAADVETDWLIAGSTRAPEIDSTCWSPALEAAGTTVFARVPGTC
ncbi:MAG: hypothetical protein R6W48_06400 [Gaiellaceae bacterium]